MTQKVKIDWYELEKMVDVLCDKINNNQYEGIYAIRRGGLIIGVMMSHKLGLPLIDRLQSYYGKKFLIVDDIADTGETLYNLKSEVFQYADIATIHYHKQSLVEPKFWVTEKGDDWIVYPWERDDSQPIQDYKVL